MPRPRVHDLDRVLDAAEELAVSAGPAAVTIRALSEATSVSNGALYHAFGSRAGLLGRAWVRAAESFLQLQRDVVEQALTGGDDAAGASAVEAVVVAALCPALFFDRKPTSTRFLLNVPRDELLRSGEVPDGVADQLRRLDTALGALFVRLSRSLWGRADRQSVAVIRDCVVELPTALLLHGDRTADPAARERLAAAVRAVLTIPPPTP
ncbi:helix-turn-helix domain-containing protein [Mycolicibacterium arseniciresistens]|uniref:Helix-turn-helix domain-containing protein n=1 Tax=Mycolicibacterium arseniciresistens TaxID=3062257 RepID=A0ABT8UGF1_9MYCO|nr:helix-turn-helix domain-containing protein [Mycolicibacterium arseniciresistens]MDO3636877.1 helix-turn-helix domain-containing protein [Mycolicibacterium arseniciresistens]